jgi:hypothetical protein
VAVWQGVKVGLGLAKALGLGTEPPNRRIGNVQLMDMVTTAATVTVTVSVAEVRDAVCWVFQLVATSRV